MARKNANKKTDPMFDTLSDEKLAHPDTLTKEPGSHPIAAGVGAALGGAATGAALGAAGAGPVGMALGAAAGGVLGAWAGHEVGEGIDPTLEHEYWRENFRSRPYVDLGDTDYELYAPAYEYGWESFIRQSETDGFEIEFDALDSELGRRWRDAHDASELSWEAARPAARDSWNRAREQASKSKLLRKPR